MPVPRNTGPTLRPAQEADAPRLAEIATAAYGHYVERMGYEPRPMTDDYDEVVHRLSVTVAEVDGEVAGFVALGEEDEGYVVDNVAVSPEHQRAGVGRALLEHAEEEARRLGYDSIYLYTHETMTENIALYARIGYAEYARRPYRDFERVFMRKPLR
jgi:ribosomal protein S18 acetylase RimI-like enzyme